MLVLVAEEVEKLLGLLFCVADLGREDRLAETLLRRRRLLVDYLLVHPVDLALDESDSLRLHDRRDVHRHGERHGQVDDRGQVVVFEHASEIAQREHARVHAVNLDGVGAPGRGEVHEVRRDEVLRSQPRVLGQLVPVARRRVPRADERRDRFEPFLSAERRCVAADARQGRRDVRPDVRELGHGGLHALGGHRVREEAPADEVRHALAHLVVEDSVVLVDVAQGALVVRLEENLLPDELSRDRGVHDGQLHARFRREVVVERAQGGEDLLLGFLSGGLVADVGELDGLAEEAGLDLGDAVFVQRVVGDVARRVCA